MPDVSPEKIAEPPLPEEVEAMAKRLDELATGKLEWRENYVEIAAMQDAAVMLRRWPRPTPGGET